MKRILLFACACAGLWCALGGGFPQHNRALRNDAGLIAYYKFDDLACRDSSGKGYNATTNNGTSYFSGKVCGALNFTGTTFVSTPIVGSTFITTSNIGATMTCWIRPIGTTPAAVFSYDGQWIIGDTDGAVGGAGGNYGLTRANIGGQDFIWAYAFDTGEKKVGVQRKFADWQHIAWVWKDNVLSIYSDGALGGTVGCASFTLTRHIYIGQAYATSFNGAIDDVRIYNRGLSATEIKSLWADTNLAYRNRKPPNLLALLQWRPQ